MTVTIKIGHHVIPVHGTDQETLDAFFKQVFGEDSGKALGCYRPPHTDIYILDTLKDDMKMSVLFHEIMEAMNDLYSVGLEHDQINLISEVLTTFVVDNPEFLKKLMEDFKHVGEREEREKKEEEETMEEH